MSMRQEGIRSRGSRRRAGSQAGKDSLAGRARAQPPLAYGIARPSPMRHGNVIAKLGNLQHL